MVHFIKRFTSLIRDFRDYSIKAKLTLIIMLTSTVTLILACLIFAIYDLLKVKDTMAKELIILAEIMGNRSSVALLFDESASAEETLSSLRAKVSIVNSCIHRPDGTLFASYSRDKTKETDCPPLTGTGVQHHFQGEYLTLQVPIMANQELVGTVYIRSDLSEIDIRIKRFINIVSLVVLLTLVLAYLMSARLQKVISDPIMSLVRTARRITENKDYSVRAELKSQDEFKVLIQAFNEMLEQISYREKALEEANEHLEERVESRTAELKMINVDLLEAKEAADAASLAKSDFLANMSHEIRTPMNGVLSACELALAEEVPPKLEGYLQIINDSGYSLLSIINDILDFSKIEAGKLELEHSPFELREMFDKLSEMFGSRAVEKEIELLVDVDPTIPDLIIGDSLRLKQVLINLVGNALKFTSRGSIMIRAKCLEKSEKQVTLALSVKDTGIGIPTEKLDKLFEAFTQVDTSTTRKFGGTGLGLTIVKKLVDLMGGEISLESQVNQGSTFQITLKMDWQEGRKRSALKFPVDLDGMKVLIVDDLPESREIMLNMIRNFSCCGETVSSGQEALERLKMAQEAGEPFGLVLLDWRMPGMDGSTVAFLIRQDLKLDVPIIMVSAFGSKELMQEAGRKGVNGYLDKPIRQSVLFDSIMDVFGKEHLATGKLEISTKTSIYKERMRGKRILLVEDNRTNQLVISAFLEDSGIDFEIAGNGREGVEAIRQKHFDAVLMDIQMPVMDGHEATRVIRQDPKYAGLPIIALTAHAMKGDEEKCRAAGMDDYVTKPINQQLMFKALWRCISAGQEVEMVKGKSPSDKEAELPSEAEPPPEGLPSRLPGIDMKEALARLDVSPEVYKRILLEFYQDFSQILRQFQAAARDDDFEAISKLSHTIKGSAGTIGAKELQRVAMTLNQTCKEGIIPEAAMIEAVDSGLTELLKSLEVLPES